jgi:hypothetical protein
MRSSQTTKATINPSTSILEPAMQGMKYRLKLVRVSGPKQRQNISGKDKVLMTTLK